MNSEIEIPAPAVRYFAAAALLLVTFAVYGRVIQNSFVDFDDHYYVTDNAVVKHGFTLEGLRFAFTNGVSGAWEPLTWLSHMADCALFGLHAAGHHIVNLELHCLSTFLLLFALTSMTGKFWRSWAVAALFALHPLHVESVAWIAERKDVLSTAFWFGAIWSYAEYVKRPGRGGYVLTLVLLALGLLAKPMLVTVPCTFLLLDYWPLHRTDDSLGPRRAMALVLEKALMFVLVAIFSAITYLVQSGVHAISGFEALSPALRLRNALYSYAMYLVMAVWPSGLAAYYPHPLNTLATWQVIVSASFLFAVSILVFSLRRRAPYLVVGWLWYLGTLVPVIGFIQIGTQGMADRYSYVPLVGIFIMLAWGLPDLCEGKVAAKHALRASFGIALVALSVVTIHQIGFWRDSETLFRRAVAVTRDNDIANRGLALALIAQGRDAEAVPHLEETIRIRPSDDKPYYDLGLAFLHLGDLGQAEAAFRAAIAHNPDHALAWNNLASILLQREDLVGAADALQHSLAVDPNNPEAVSNYAALLLKQGKNAEAEAFLRDATKRFPNSAPMQNNLGAALKAEGKTDEAIGAFKAALRIDPAQPDAIGNLEALGILVPKAP